MNVDSTDAGIADAGAAEMAADGHPGSRADRLAGVTGRLLAQAEVQLALVESVTAGEVARLLRTTAEGAGVVVAAHGVDGPAALARTLGLSAAKLDAFGWVSEMVAAESAATLIDTYEGGWGLAILGASVGEGEADGYIALGTPSTTTVIRYPYAGGGALAHREAVTLRVLDLLRRQAIAKLEITRRSS